MATGLTLEILYSGINRVPSIPADATPGTGRSVR